LLAVSALMLTATRISGERLIDRLRDPFAAESQYIRITEDEIHIAES
jgi:hypothetical protein